MRARIRNLSALARRFGWTRAAEVLALWIARRVVDYREAYVYCLDLSRMTMPPGCDRFVWAYSRVRDVDRSLSADLPSSTTDGGEPRCFIGLLDGAQCYASVVSDDGFSVPDRVRVSFVGSTQAYVGDCITLPAHRGKGVYPCGLAQLGQRLFTEGKTSLYLFIERENLASIRSVEKVGFERVAVCSVSKLGGTSRRRWRFVPFRSSLPEPQWTVEVFS